MASISPLLDSTRVHPITKEWLPTSFANFLLELKTLSDRLQEAGALVLFRGQRRREWRLDSTLARSIKSQLFKIPLGHGYSERMESSRELHAALTNIFLFKFGSWLVPTDELLEVESAHGVDAWFELMKRHQQYPEEDTATLGGTIFIDWSQSSDVALFFANDQRDSEGALFVCNATATGNTLQELSVREVLGKVRDQLSLEKPLGAPLLFCPKKQISNQRAKNQAAIYFAQMDLRVDLEKMWRLKESEDNTKSILTKIILPKGSEPEFREYLINQKIDYEYIFPDLPTSVAI